jgi:class 3 adenylate cyclase
MRVCPSCGEENPDKAKFCHECATALPDAARSPAEVRKTVTVVFCDITGSTAIGERLDPESLRRVQTDYFDVMSRAIGRHGGTVEKYIGDAVMAVFGIPTVHEDDALRAVRAAAEMREALADLNKELERDRGVVLQVRIGVNTGEVVASGDATSQAMVTGDAVNVAARLEQAAAPGEIFLGEATYQLARDAVDVEAVEPLPLKGKAEPVPAFRLVRIVPGASGHARSLDRPIVGRERELRLLEQTFERVVSDEACQLFTVLAPPGVGKSRLIEEFSSSLTDSSVLRGRCLPYGEGITFFPVVDVVKQAAGLGDFDPPELVEEQVCAVLEGEEHREVICGRVTQLLGVAEEAAPDETFWAIRRFLEAVARDRPLVVVFEDLHWGEGTFLDLVEHIADWSRGASILLLCTARPELLDRRPGWGGGKLNAVTISLEPLSDESCTQLIANALDSTELPEGLAARIAASAEGNPLFIEEMLAMLIAQGAIERESGRWITTTNLDEVTVPATISALLAARLDQLSADEREALGAASIIGKEFFVGAVRELIAEARRDTTPQVLMSLVRKELIRPVRSSLPGEDALRFRHMLIRDAAYDALPKEIRATLHERFADWLERRAGDRLSEQEEIVGYHLEQTWKLRAALGPPDEVSLGVANRAAERLESAAHRARDRGDVRAAEELLTRASGLPSAIGTRVLAFVDLADLRSDLSDNAGVTAAMDAASDLARDLDDERIEAHVLLRRIALIEESPERRWADLVAEAAPLAIKTFAAVHDEDGMAYAWHLTGFAEWERSRAGAAADAWREAATHAHQAGNRTIERDAWVWIAIASYFGPATIDEALPLLAEIRKRLRGSPVAEAKLGWVSISFEAALDEDYDAARASLAHDSSVLRDAGLQFEAAHFGAQVLLDLALYEGDLVGAERVLREGYEECVGLEGSNRFLAALLALSLADLGNLDEADAFLELASGPHATASPHQLELQITLARSAIALGRGNHAAAVRHAREAMDLLAGSDFEWSRAGCAWRLGAALDAEGDRDGALRLAEEAARSYERKGLTPLARQVRHRFGINPA